MEGKDTLFFNLSTNLLKKRWDIGLSLTELQRIFKSCIPFVFGRPLRAGLLPAPLRYGSLPRRNRRGKGTKPSHPCRRPGSFQAAEWKIYTELAEAKLLVCSDQAFGHIPAFAVQRHLQWPPGAIHIFRTGVSLQVPGFSISDCLQHGIL